MAINLLPDRRDYLISTHNFIVTIGPLVLNFMKVSNISANIEYDAIPEGGNNDYPNLFQKPKHQADTLILEKGVKNSISDIDFNLLREGMLVEVVNVLILKNNLPVKNFFFKTGIITKREFSSLDAVHSEILVQKMEIAHSGLVEVTLPSI